MTIVDDIIAARDCGVVRCGLLTHPSPSVSELASEFGLESDPGIYREITQPDARFLIQSILQQDLAYDSQVMSAESASKLTDSFLEPFKADGTLYYTNGTFYEVPPRRTTTWNPATNATFDTGVLIRGATVSGCLWVEDED